MDGKVPAIGEHVRAIYFDGEGRPLRSIDGEWGGSDDDFVFIRSGRLLLQIGKKFVIKIERWVDERRQSAEVDRHHAFEQRVGDGPK